VISASPPGTQPTYIVSEKYSTRGRDGRMRPRCRLVLEKTITWLASGTCSSRNSVASISRSVPASTSSPDARRRCNVVTASWGGVAE
jgi:hypothetical protein